MLRRLNRREYINTIGDLFAMNMAAFDPTTKFPRDQSAEHMENLGDVLQTSGYLLDRYLDAADAVVEKAFALKEPLRERTWQFKDYFGTRAKPPTPEKAAQDRFLNVLECMDSSSHEGGYAYLYGFREGVPADGLYEVKVLVEARNRVHPYAPEIFGTDAREPFRLGIVPGDAKLGPLDLPQPLQPMLAEQALADGEPKWHTMRVWLDAGQTPRFVFPNGSKSSRSSWFKIAEYHKDKWPKAERENGKKGIGIVEARRLAMSENKFPHIRIHEVKIRGPIVEQWPPVTQQAVLGKTAFAPARTREVLQSFADRAYRRPATANEIELLLRVFDLADQQDDIFTESVKLMLKSVLISPHHTAPP